MACCKVCCGCAICEEGDQGKCCCGEGSAATCCQEGEYCCGGACQAEPCEECETDEDCPNLWYRDYYNCTGSTPEPDGPFTTLEECGASNPYAPDCEATCNEVPQYCCNGACQETPCIDCNSPPATDSDPNISCACNSDYIGEYCGEQGDCFVTYLEPCPAFYAECCPLDCLEFQDPGGPIFLCDELP